MKFAVLRSKGSGPFGTPVLSITRETDGVSEIVAYLEEQPLAMRVVELLNRNGMVDVPLPSLEGEG